MEKFSYNNNSYPDSTDSSPRSREIDFDNPQPWDNNEQTYKVKFMCSYGGKIQPRPHDNQLTYVNGETKILSVDRNVRFSTLSTKLSNVCADVDVSFKYQLPGEDLDALISVTNDDDLEHMMHEYDRLLRVSSKPARLRLFLFPITGFGSQGSTQSDRDRFVEALNTVPEKSVTVTNPVNNNNVDFLFGSEKIVAQPPQPVQEVKLPVPVKVIEPDPIEFQRMQIRDPPPYAAVPQTVTQTPPPPMNFWQGNNNSNNNSVPVFTTGLGVPEKPVFPTSLGVPEQPVYMIPSQPPGGVYQPQLQAQGVMRPVQGNQGGYYPPGPVQRMVSDTYREQGAYTMAQQQLTKLQQQLQYSGVPPPQHSAVPPPQYSAVPPPQHSGVPLPQYSAVPPPQYSVVPPPQQGVETTTYMPQVNYGGGMGKQVYYTEAPAPAPQYHGIGLPVTGLNELRTGPDGKIVGMSNIITSKVSSQNSDSAV